MDFTQNCVGLVECESSHLPEFPVSEKRERGLWNKGEEGSWLHLLDILWRRSNVRNRLAGAALLGSTRTASLIQTAHRLERGESFESSFAEETSHLQESRTGESAGTEALYKRLLQRAIQSAAALECTGGESRSPASACAQSGSYIDTQEKAEPRACIREFECAEDLSLKVLRSASLQIPPILHFVWCGGKPLPEFFLHFKRSWKNSPLVHALWTDAEIKDLVILAKGKDFHAPHAHRYQRIVSKHSGDWKRWRQVPNDTNMELDASRILAELARMVDEEERLGPKSDLIRLLLLHSYGGVYADIDMELIREFPTCFLTDATFFAGAQRDDAVELGNALLGCTPRHALLTYIIHQIVEHGASTDEDDSVRAFRIIECYTSKSSLLWQGMRGSPLVRSNQEAMEVIRSTGPGQLTRAIMGWLQSRASSLSCRGEVNCGGQEDATTSHRLNGLESVCICPPCVFYPVPNHARNNLKRGDKAKYIKTRFSFTVHHWKETWREFTNSGT